MDGPVLRPNKWRSNEEWTGILSRALPDFACRACGERMWYAQTAIGQDAVGVLHYVAWSNSSLQSYVASVPFVCGSCGLVEIFSETELLRRARVGDEQ